MTATDRWRELHARRFPELCFDCRNSSDPGVLYSADLRDWSTKATTPDQRRIEHYIDRFDLRQKRILHVGIGNSGLAKRFHGRVKEIVGTTIDEPELEVARLVALPNYSAAIHNKYSGASHVVRGKFDLIIDNNPTSPCCCVRHLAALFDFYADCLAQGGQIVTDRQGLGWVPKDSNSRWSFDFDDLAAVATVAGLSSFRATGSVYVLSQTAPPAPDVLSLSRHMVRRAGMLPGKIIRNAPRALVRVIRKPVKWMLASTNRPDENADR